MTIAKDFAAKASVAFVAAAMIFSMFAPSAKAQSAEDLQKMINDLLAQIASLQSQVGQGGSSAAGVCPYTWTRDLNVGATGADVKMLQMFLNANADTRVAASGAGSAGMETEYYGPATAAAVSKMQVMYRAEVLSPAGLVNPTGYFGPSTRAKANSLCVAAPVVTPGDDGDDDGDMTDDEDDMTSLSGEADLDKFEVDSADDDTIEEGASDAPVAQVTVQFVDGDASISRMDVQFASGDATDMWDVLETVSLWVDGDMVAEKSADNKSDYLGDEDDGILRFSGLDIVGMEDEDLDIVVAVSLQNNLDNNDLQSFNVQIDAVRFFDADGVATTDDSTDEIGTNVSFTVEEAGSDDELVVKTSSSDPDATTLKVEDDSKSDWYTVFVFDLDTDDSVNDITLNEVPVTVTLGSTTMAYSTIVDDAELVIDGVTIDDFDVSSTTIYNPVLTFNVDGDVTIDAGDRVEAELKLRFKSLAVTSEGVTVQGSVTSTNADAIDAEGADTLEPTSPNQLSGAATGDAHTLRTKGAAVSLDSDSAVVTAGDSANDDYATFKLVLEVTAFEQDVNVSTNVATSVVYSIVDGAGNTVTASSVTAVVDSSADVEGGSFKINEGETETVTLTVTFDAATAGSAARLQLTSLVFGENDGDNDQTWSALPATDYRTDIVTLVN